MSKNQHITEFLDYYCKLEKPEYAVLLKGSWGSGKTWFITNYLEKYKEKQKIQYLHISLYGIKNIPSIEYKILQQRFSILKSPVGRILKDIKDALPQRINVNTDKIQFSEYLNNTQDILIFDDLERCQMPMKEVLGYINNFIEHKGFKVIIIAAEKEIPEKDKDDYNKSKEKSIGHSFEIQSHIDEVLPSLINKLNDTVTKEVLNNNSITIKELYTQANCNNFRILKQTLWDFERLYKILPEDAKKKHELITHLLSQLFIYSFAIKDGKIQPKDIGIPNLLNEENKKIYGEYKYPYFIYLYTPLVDINTWRNFFDKGILPDMQKLKESLSESTYYKEDNTSILHQLIKNIRELSDEEFEKLQKQLETEYDNKKYNIPTVLTIIGLFLHWSDIGLYQKEKKDILHNGQEYINYLLSQDEYSTCEALDQINYRQFGHIFHDAQVPHEYEALSQYIDTNLAKSKLTRMQKKGLTLIQLLQENPEQFAKKIYLSSYNNDGTYAQIPILQYINPEDFIKIFANLKAIHRETIHHALIERYKYEGTLQHLTEELDWLKNIQKLLSVKELSLKGKLSGFYINLFLTNLKPIIEKMETLKTQNSTST